MPATNVSPQLLNDQEVIERLKALRQKQPVKYTAFYSSQLGGIVTDPALMVLPFDDHMVHRGHGIFDTAGIVQWDHHTIGNGKPGPIASALLALLEEDMRTGDRLIDVPY